MRLSPTLRILYILAVSVVVFVFPQWWVVVGLLGLQLLVWLALRIPLRHMRSLRKISTFALLLIFFYAFFSGDKDFALIAIKKWGFELLLSSKGALTGGLMVLKILTMLLATLVVRLSMKPEDFITGLRGLGLSKDAAEILDGLFGMIASEGKGKGKGRRKNKKRNKMKEGEDKGSEEEPVISIRDVLKGNLSGIPKLINQKLAEAQTKFANSDVAIIAAFTAIVTLIRFMKILPGFPIAPGHKNVLLIPFFILGARMTKKPYAATFIGFLSGVVHFAAGFGKYGPLGILQFALLGLVVDLLMLVFKHSKSIFVFGLIGFLAGLTRVSAEITLALILDAPEELYLVYSPYILSQCIFGAASGIVTKYLINRIAISNV